MQPNVFRIGKKRATGLFLALALWAVPVQSISALTIIRDFIGGQPGHSDVGTGNLAEIFNAAADIWEQAIQDDHVLVLHFGWAPNGGGEHFLVAQGGTPNCETEGIILFNNDDVEGHHHFYLDPTPCSNEEYQTFTETTKDLGGGTINIGRCFNDPVGDADSFGEDLLSIALHEIGHALGLSAANTSFISESVDGDIDITARGPFAGSVIELAFNNFGVTTHFDGTQLPDAIMTGQRFFQRQMPSAADILAMAKLSQFTHLNLGLSGLGEDACTRTVQIDINPGNFPNSINLGKPGEIPVAILTTKTFDAASVNPLSVEFGPGRTTEKHGRGHLKDVNGDGKLDLVLHFNSQATGILCGATSASVTGRTFSGQSIKGSDSIKTVGCKPTTLAEGLESRAVQGVIGREQ